MERTQAPQLAYDSELSCLHPINVFRLAINAIATAEHWRQHAGETLSPFAQRIQANHEARMERHEESMEVNRLACRAIANPDNKGIQAEHLEARRTYHYKRAGELGLHVTSMAIKSERPPLFGLRQWVTEKKADHHIAQFRKAANRLLSLGS